MLINFSEETRKIIIGAKEEMIKLKHPYVGSEHIILSMLKYSENIIKAFENQNISYELYKNKLIDILGSAKKNSEHILYTPFLRKIISNSVIEAREQNRRIVNPEILLFQIIEEKNGIAYTILCNLNMDFEKLCNDLKKGLKYKKKKGKKTLLDEIGVDLTKKAKDKKIDQVIGRNKEIEEVIQILTRRKKNNPILIGQAGVGKTAIVEGIADLISKNKVPTCLQSKRIISLNIYSLVAGTKYRGEFEEKMKTLIKELEDNEDIILFIDEIHTIVGAGGAEGAIDASNIFKPALARGSIKIIGATTIDEYSRYIEPDQALSRRFQKIQIDEPNEKELKNILFKTKPLYEKHHNVFIKDKLIHKLVKYSNMYVKGRYEPDKSIDILDEVCSMVSLKKLSNDKKTNMLKNKLKDILKEKQNSYIQNDYKRACELKEQEKQISNKIEKIRPLKKEVKEKDIIKVIEKKHNCKIINLYSSKKLDMIKHRLYKSNPEQIKAIDKIIYYLKRYNLASNNTPFKLIINESSTHDGINIVKDLSKNINNNIIELDLSLFNSTYSINKLIGYNNNNKVDVFTKVKLKPFSTIIIKNSDEACEEVMDIIKDVLKKGYSYDITGKKVYFDNTMIFILNKHSEKNIGFSNKSINNNDIEKLVEFRVNLEDLSKNNINSLVERKINILEKKYNIKIKLTQSSKNNIIDKCKNNNYTVETFESEIKNTVEKYIIDKLIDNNRIYKLVI